MNELREIIFKQDELTIEDIQYLSYKTANRDDFVALNHIEQLIKNSHGSDFVERSKEKIEIVISFLLKKDEEGLYDFYKDMFDFYMASSNFSFDDIINFNFVFITYMHLSLKVMREANYY